LLFEEPDDLYWVGISKTLDGKYMFIETASVETSELHYLDLEDPAAKLECIAKRRSKVLYTVEHRLGYWWIVSRMPTKLPTCV
jgi:oligopeptidase B